MKTTFIPDGNPTKLVVDGPFKISRNPIYLGMVLILLGTAIISSIIFFAFSNNYIFLIINFTWITHEEKKLSKIFEEIGKNTLKTRRWL